jgi:hypothetical protein
VTVGFELDFDTCFEVDEALIERALAPPASLEEPTPREKIFALIERMAAVARPRQGAARLLVVLATVARASWLEGALEVWLRPLGELTEIELLLHDGLSYTRLCSPLLVGAPFDEFEMSIARAANLLAPLELADGAPSGEIRLHAPDKSAPPSTRAALSSESFAPPPGDELQHKQTVKIPVVRIPAEAYREDQRKTDAPDGSSDMPRESLPDIRVEVEPDTDDIDESWDE